MTNGECIYRKTVDYMSRMALSFEFIMKKNVLLMNGAN